MSRRGLEGIEAAYLGAAAGLLAVGGGGLLLAEAGRYSPWVAGLPALALLGLAGSACRSSVRALRPLAPLRTPEGGLLVLVLVVTAALASPPHEILLGDTEAGVSAALAAHLSRTGSPTFADTAVEVAPARTGAPPGEPARTGSSTLGEVAPGHGTPGGPHLLTVLLATAHGVAGLRGVHWAGTLLAVMAAAGLALLARRLFDDRTAVWAAILLAANPARIWFSRSPTAENLASTLSMAGLLALVVALETGGRGLAFLAGLSLGAVHLVWTDAWSIPLVLGLGLAHACVRRRPGGVHLWIGAGYLPLAAHAAAHGAFPGPARMARDLLGGGASVAATALGAALVACLAAGLGRRRLEAALSAAGRPGVARGAAAAIVALGIHAYYVQPRLAEPAHGFASLGWYTDPLGLLLAVLGFSVAIVRHRSTGFGPFLLLAFLETARYAAGGHLVPDHFRAARPALVVVFPALALFAAHMLVSLARAIREEVLEAAAPPLIGLALTLSCLVGWLPFRSHVEQLGAIEQVGRLAAILPEEAVVLFDESQAGRQLALPLQLVWGRSSVIVRRGDGDPALGATLAGPLAANRPVYRVKDRGASPPGSTGGDERPVATAVIDLPVHAATVGQRPDRITRLRLDLAVFRVR